MCMREKNVPFTSRTPTYLTPEQRHALTQIPAALSDREIARYYTFTRDRSGPDQTKEASS